MQRSGATHRSRRPPTLDPTSPAWRLAELVAHLLECGPSTAVDAVIRAMAILEIRPDGHGWDDDTKLEIVAGAIVLLRQDIDLRDVAFRRPA